jgi:DNA ligase (NAD+)
MTQTIERMERLITQLRKASHAYYNENREIMSNQAYDALYDELAALEAQSGTALSNSPTQQVGFEVVEGLSKVAHQAPMLSLDKTKEPAKLAAFLEGHTGVLSWKLDGLALVLKYDNGRFVQAITRGNGHTGEDVSHTARVFANIPLRVSHTGAFTVRGEAVITNEDFERINQTEADILYKNPRNLCSGTVRQLNSEIAAGRRVRFVAVGLVNKEGFEKKSQQLAWLAGQGFEVVEHVLVTAQTAEQAVADFQGRVQSQPIASDGLVLTYDDLAYSESLGATSKFPRDAIAFKWTDELAQTTLLGIEWNTSRTGLINPIAVFEPVEIEGTTVNRASLHNVSIVRGLRLGVGDVITVYKANMIIPQVAENLTKSDTAAIPAQCPVCKADTQIISENECEALCCPSSGCRAQLISGLSHFAGRDAMNIEGLSEQTLEKLVEKGMVADYTDLFCLERHEQAILQMDGFGQKSYDNLQASLQRAKNVSLPNFIYALGIKHVGLANAKLLCAYYQYDMARIVCADEQTLTDIKGFGGAIAQSLLDYFGNEKNRALLDKILPQLQFSIPEATQDKPLSGLTFVITGEVHHFANRKAVQAFIESHGGRVATAVSAKTDYLINNDANSASSKNKKAAQLDVPILSEEQLLQNHFSSILK